MRPIQLAVFALGVLACRDEPHDPLDRRTRAAVEEVGDQRDEVVTSHKAATDERADVDRAQAENRPASKVAEEQAEAVRASGEQVADRVRFAKVREEFLRLSQVQIDLLGRRIDAAAARWGPAGRDQIAVLRREHARLAQIRASVVDDPDADWRDYQQQFVTQVNTIEENLKSIMER